MPKKQTSKKNEHSSTTSSSSSASKLKEKTPKKKEPSLTVLKKKKKEADSKLNKLRWIQQGWLNTPPSKVDNKTEDNDDIFRKLHYLRCSNQEMYGLPCNLWSPKLKKNEFKSEQEAKLYRENHDKFMDAYKTKQNIDKAIKKKEASNGKKKEAGNK